MDNKEVWKDIVGYEGIYQISSFGRIKSLSREVFMKGKYPFQSTEKILNPSLNNLGYQIVTLSKEGKGKLHKTHQLVALMFLNHKTDGTHKVVIDHIDNNKLNNAVDNLQLISHRKNISKDKKGKTSQYEGVWYHKDTKKYGSNIQVNGKLYALGYFEKEEDASIMYNNAIIAINEDTFEKFFEEVSNNKKLKYSSSHVGVSFHKATNKWRAYKKINGKTKHLGIFLTENEAINVVNSEGKQEGIIKETIW